MNDLLLGLLAWFGVGILVSLLIGRFMRMPEQDEGGESEKEKARLPTLPGYGWEDTQLSTKLNSAATSQHSVQDHPKNHG